MTTELLISQELLWSCLVLLETHFDRNFLDEDEIETYDELLTFLVSLQTSDCAVRIQFVPK